MIDRQTSHCLRQSAKALAGVAVAAAVLLLPVVVSSAPSIRHFQANLMPLNVSVGGDASGTATLTREADGLTIDVNVKDLSPGMHMIHIHGFTTGDKAASCATPTQDKNGGGIIDLDETTPVSGTTLIPFNDQPVTLKIASDTYPKANVSGELVYRKTVSAAHLVTSLKQQFGIDSVQLDRRVIFVHGVPDSSHLPATVKSLPRVPANLTLPIACGVIQAEP